MPEVELTSVPKFDTLEIIKTGTVTVAFANDGATQTTTLPHGLGIVPVVMAFFDNTTHKSPLPSILVEPTGSDAGKVLQIISWYADDTNIYFYNQSQLQGTAGGTIRYFALRQRSGDV